MRISSLFISLLLVCVVYSQDSSSSDDAYPCPFYRPLTVTNPPLSGSDVYILQNFLTRNPLFLNLQLTGQFDAATSAALAKFQSINSIVTSSPGDLDLNTANQLLEICSDDGYVDNGTVPPGFKYKVFVPVYRNRSIETTATLFDSNNNVLLKFTVRTHGQNVNTTGEAQNQFCNNGYTPTGLMTFDLNSPEPDPVSFGPYPINRAVQGIAGNAFIVISQIRDGILLHTGEWPDWNPSLPMPNSHGCIHAHPTDIDAVQTILTTQLGVGIRDNMYTAVPYLHQPQGILSIQLMD